MAEDKPKVTAAERRRLQAEVREEIAAETRRVSWLKWKVQYGATSEWSTPFKPGECWMLLELIG